MADHLTVSQPGGADYAHHITTCPPRILRPSYGLAVSYAWFAIPAAVIHTQYEFSRLISLRMINFSTIPTAFFLASNVLCYRA